MIILTTQLDNAFIMFGESYEDRGDGYFRILKADGSQIDFNPSDIFINEIVNFIDGVEPFKYCYTPETGFYENPNYVEPNPYGIPDELVERIKNDAIKEVEEAVINADK